jgi:molybdenum cofactor guanylyltransferase
VTSNDKSCRSSGRFTFHPFEIALCGYSGSGKTTLACRLLERWQHDYVVGFVKHDAHRFEMDRAGKDTHAASEAGAASIMINDPRHFARISTLPYSRFERAYAFVDADFVLAEGFKHSDLPKLLLLDS